MELFYTYPFIAWGPGLSMGGIVAGGLVVLFIERWSSALATPRMRTVGGVLLAFGGASVLSLFVILVIPEGDLHFQERVEPGAGPVGPLKIPENNTQMEMKVTHSIQPGQGSFTRWSFVTIEILDANKDYLLSFGGEFWHYGGWDDYGYYWVEADTEYETVLRFPSAGTYYFQVKTEANVNPSELSAVAIEMDERGRWGNPRSLGIASFFAFFFGTVVLVGGWRGRFKRILSHLQEGRPLRLKEQTWQVDNQVDRAYDGWRVQEWELHSADSDETAPRYLEYEYKGGGIGTNWLFRRPVSIEKLRSREDQEVSVQQYVASNEEFPIALTFEGEDYFYEESGEEQQEDTSFSYRIYEDKDENKKLKIEWESLGDFEAFAEESVSAWEVLLVEEETKPA